MLKCIDKLSINKINILLNMLIIENKLRMYQYNDRFLHLEPYFILLSQWFQYREYSYDEYLSIAFKDPEQIIVARVQQRFKYFF